MTTTYLSDFRAKLVLDLSNTALGRWTSTAAGELDAATLRALREFSDAFPYLLSTEIAASAGVRKYDLTTAAAGALSFKGPLFVQVECPYVEANLPDRNPCAFRVVNNCLFVDVDTAPAANDKIQVFWNSLHTLSESVRTYPTDYEDMLVVLAAAYALLQRAASSVNAVNVGGTGTPAAYIQEALFRRQMWEAFVQRHKVAQ